MGGAAVVRSCLDAGLPDRLTLYVSPQTYGAGTPLFAGSGALAGQAEITVSESRFT
jgi:dihydrofolate reductase